MINIFTLDHGRLVNIKPEEIASRKPIWLDISEPSDEERAWVNEHFPSPCRTPNICAI